MPPEYVAVDLGASSGRIFRGRLQDRRFEVERVAAKPNQPVQRRGSLHWDVERLFSLVAEGVATACAGRRAASLGIDAWGVDYALVDSSGDLVGPPHHYRDPRTIEVFRAMQDDPIIGDVYRTTGIQNLPINTLYQLLATDPVVMAKAERLLFIPDLMVYRLTGLMQTEPTIASTSQLFNVFRREWDHPLCTRLGIPSRLLPNIAATGGPRGTVTSEMARRWDLPDGLAVVSPASHDTASAVVAIPAQTADWAFVSSGTWSIVGMESAYPIVTDRAREANISNEAGVGGTTRLVRNVMGLWLLEQSRGIWNDGGLSLSLSELQNLAAQSDTRAVIDPDHPEFLPAGDIPERIRIQCARHGQQPPETPGETARCILVSLALAYRRAIENLSSITGKVPEVIHIVGGGSANTLLCSFTASACRRPVVAGPLEATALGNLLVQAQAAGDLGSMKEARQVVRSSVTTREYLPVPRDVEEMDEGYEVYLDVAGRRTG